MRPLWPWITSISVLVVLCGLLGAAAWVNHGNVGRWQDTADQAAAERDAAQNLADELSDEVGVLEGHLDEVKEALAVSEGDVADLEGRLGDVANEKALVEDEREAISAAADRIAEVAVAYDDLADLFSECVSAQQEFSNMMVNYEAYWYSGQAYVVEDHARYTGQVCGSAQSFLVEIRRYVNALVG
jgi:chromosome segregation ATPase